MTPDQISVLLATPHSDAVSSPMFRIAEQAKVTPPRAMASLLALKGMGLVDLVEAGYASYWSRTPIGDREARRAS